MTDDVERLLESLTPRGAPDDLRPRVARAVADELAATAVPRPPRRVPPLLATAAAVVLSFGASHWAYRVDDERLDRIFGPRPISRDALDLARDVAATAGPDAGRWVLDRLTASSPATTEVDLSRRATELRRMIHELTFDAREDDHETTPQTIPQVGRDRRRPRAGRLLLVERVLHLEHRESA